MRMCVDYRALNSITKKNRYPLPIIEDQINNLAGARCFTSLDLFSGYYQVPVVEGSIDKTAFVTPDGQYEFLRVPFGLVNAPSVFSRLVSKVIAPLYGKVNDTVIEAYIDDIIIASGSTESGLQSLIKMLQRLREVGLTLKLKKCQFLMPDINFLGYEISKDGVKPGEFKIEAMRKFGTPRNAHEVRQFIGLASYFRKFVRNFATLARPLTKLTRKMQPWQWEEEQENAFSEIKERLIARPVLATYKKDAETELHTDASKWGLGGILLQRQSNNQLQPVAYYSRQTTKEEQRYHSYELETLAVISSLHRFRVFLIGLKFKIVSDCSALRATFVKRDLSPRVGRWWIQLQEYECEFDYRAGSKMPHVDALSRHAIEDLVNADEIQEIGVYSIQHDDRIYLAQLQDERLRYINEILNREAKDGEERDIKKQFALKNNRVYKVTNDGLKWAVPRTMRRNVTRICHDEIGHVGLDKTLKKLNSD